MSDNIKIGAFRPGRVDGSVEFDLSSGLESETIFFRSRPGVLNTNNDALLTLMLLKGMEEARRLEFADSRFSEQLLTNMTTIQEMLRSWDDTLTRVEIEPLTGIQRAPLTTGGVGTFFTGGMDSFYTLLKHRAEITHLVFVHGFDIALDDHSLRDQTSQAIHRIAREFRKVVIEVETNVRSMRSEFVGKGWGPLGHGPALAGIGHLLAPSLRRIYIPASFTYRDLFPWGTHPLLDPLWGSEQLEFVHDGCEATRVDKAQQISQSNIALNNLRVCYKNADSVYNCGRCEKCIRTKINLYAVGALERCTVFPNASLDATEVFRINATGKVARIFVTENLNALYSKGVESDICSALERLLKRPRVTMRLKGHFRHWAWRIRNYLHSIWS